MPEFLRLLFWGAIRNKSVFCLPLKEENEVSFLWSANPIQGHFLFQNARYCAFSKAIITQVHVTILMYHNMLLPDKVYYRNPPVEWKRAA